MRTIDDPSGRAGRGGGPTVADQRPDDVLRGIGETRVSRRGFLAASGFTAMSAYLAACAGGGTQPAFFMYNWADYVAPDNQAKFKERFNIADANFTYDTYASNEELFAKLQGGATGQYDVCCPTAEWVPAMVEEGFLEKIDWSKIPNAKYINPQFKGLWWDPNDEYQLPKDWGTTGISMRTNVVTEDVRTWKDFFEIAPKYSGRIVVVDSPGDVFTAPLKALGFSLNSVDPGELEQARTLLMDLAPHVLALNSDTYEEPMKTEEAVLGLTWTGGIDEMLGDPQYADTTKYQIPEDGTLFWLDTWTILKDAPHLEMAHNFLNFIHEPEIQAVETEVNYYATPNEEAKKHIDPEILNNPIVFVPQDVQDSGLLEAAKDVSLDPLRQEIWEQFKSSIGG
jgi:spermidine/putrescine transport system substrate-binding protein